MILLAAFGLGMRFFVPNLVHLLGLVLFLGLAAFVPGYRHLVLAVAPLVLVVMKSFRQPLLLGMNLAVVALGIFLYWCAMRWPKSRFGRRPIVFLLSGFSGLILLACATAPHSLPYSILWNLVGLMASYVWFIGYALMDRGSNPSTDLTLELAAFRPLWGSSNTPYPKGAAYLRRIEAQNSEQLAVVQLKGLKLLAWAILLGVFQSLWLRFFHGYLHLPTSAEALTLSLQGTPAAWHTRWESLILAFFELMLTITIMGHYFIATCRMAGFNALRNTYRPLSSTSLMEFFNRFYYYFKELVVDFFFYPAFLRYWKKHRRMRMAFATFAAAGFGNAFYHFTRDWQIIRDRGIWMSLENFQAYLCYCAILATGLCISQLRRRGHAQTGFVRGRLVPAFCVCLFYCFLNVFDSGVKGYPLIGHFRYIESLFFIHF